MGSSESKSSRGDSKMSSRHDTKAIKGGKWTGQVYFNPSADDYGVEIVKI